MTEIGKENGAKAREASEKKKKRKREAEKEVEEEEAERKTKKKKSLEKEEENVVNENGEEKKKRKKKKKDVGEAEEEGTTEEKNGVDEEQKEKKKGMPSRISDENGHENGSVSEKSDVIEVISTSGSIDEDKAQRLLRFLNDHKDDDSSRSTICASASTVPFISALLVSYSATRTEKDRVIYSNLQMLERIFSVNLAQFAPLVFGEKARANYDKLRELGRFLHVRPTPDQVVGWLSSEQLQKTALHGDREQAAVPPEELYDLRFILRLLASVTQPASDLTCRLFADSCCLSLVFSATSSLDEETRRMAFYVLQRYLALLGELKTEDFPERSLFIYLIRLFKNSIETETPRIPHVISHFFARMSRLLLQPTEPLYAPLLAFLTLKPTIELQQVPELFKLLLSSSTTNHEEEQVWILELMSTSLVDSSDYALLENRSAVRLVCSHFASNLSTVKTRRAALALLKAVARIPPVAFDALCRQNMGGWLAAVIQRPSLSRWETIYLAEVYSLLIERARQHSMAEVGGKKEREGEAEKKRKTKQANKAAASIIRSLATVTAPTVVRALSNGEEEASKRIREEILEALKRNWPNTENSQKSSPSAKEETAAKESSNGMKQTVR